MNPLERIRIALDTLASYQNTIPSLLARRLCKGLRLDSAGCPAAKWLARLRLPKEPVVFSTHCVYDGSTVFYPSAVRRVVQDFDAGLLPELEAKPCPKPN